jgi:glutamyl-tRNA synthetase
MGYLPEALINYLVRLGWSHGDQEIFSLQEMIDHFSFDHVQKSAAVFNPDKLLWMNAQYIKQGEPARIAALLLPFLDQVGVGDAARKAQDGWLVRLVRLFQERARTLVEMAQACVPYLQEEADIEAEAAAKLLTQAIVPALESLTERFAAITDFSHAPLEAAFKQVIEERGLKMGQLAQPVRLAVTGRTASPGLFEVIELLGRDRTLARLKKGIERAKRGA